MKNNKVCISTKVGYFSLFVFILILSVFFTSKLVEQQTSTSTRAATVSSKIKTLAPHIAYGDAKCTDGQKSWFGACIDVNDVECSDSCIPSVTVADMTSYGKDLCSSTRCIPISVKSKFIFDPSKEASPFCERVTGKKGATCYSPWTKSTVKDINIYEQFFVSNGGSNAAYFQKKINNIYDLITGTYQYQIECPIYVSYASGFIDNVLKNLGGVKKGAWDHIESGYCYTLKVPSPNL